jgi:BASS family bile acid:Na+ symporter
MAGPRTLLPSMQHWLPLAILALKISICMQVFATGLGAGWRDAVYLFRHPRLLVNSILARNVIVPVVAILLIWTFSLPAAIAITLGVLAVTPVPPLVPRSQVQAGAHSDYVLGLLVSQSLLAIVLVPLTIEWMDWAVGVRAHFPPVRTAGMIAETILIPLAAGMLAVAIRPSVQRFAPKLLLLGTVLLVVGAAPLLFLGWKALAALAGNGSLLAIAIFVVAGMAAGHLLGGPRHCDRIALAIATPARHPALAVAIAQANYREQGRLVAGAVVIYLVLRLILLVPYVRWQRLHRKEA